jgi:glycosyltransferase involved in cell wall biosynthesis
MNQLDLTVAIPTYNGSKRLPKILEQLSQQINVENIKWDVLIVDNNSQDETAELIKSYQQKWLDKRSLNYCFEQRQGAAFARQKAIAETQSEWVAFLDDDIIPALDWVANAYKFSQEHPQVGAYGGQIHGDFEISPPNDFQRIASFLAIRERGETAHLYDAKNLSLPPSAAWIVRREAWLKYVPPIPTLSGRTKGSMVQGDDYEPLLYLHKAGWEIWYNPAMHVNHKIPSQRLERNYLIALSKGCGICVFQLRLINTKSWQKPLLFTRIVLANFRRVLIHLFKYKQQVKTDLVAACEMAFLLSCMLSPFYFLQTTILAEKKS